MSFIMGLVGKFITPFMPYILCGSITIITILTIMLNTANTKYDSLVIDAATKIERAQLNTANLEIVVGEQKASIEALLIEKGESRARVEQQNEFAADLQIALNEERLRNESYKSRWSNISSRRPEALARLANAATRKRVQLFAEITCRGSNCNRDGDSGDRGGTTEEAGSNNTN